MNDTTREDRLMAALSHASALLPIMGAAIPIGIWISQKDRSPLLKFHALQALTYQIIAIVLYFLMMACQMVTSFAVLPLMMAPMILNNSQTQEISGLLLVIFLISMVVLGLVSILFNVVMLVGGPTYIIIALIGAWRVLKGRDFYYPILGRRIEKKLLQNSTS